MAMSDAPHPTRAPARWQDYVQLLKPRVMSLVVFTGLTGLVCAGRPINPILRGRVAPLHRRRRRRLGRAQHVVRRRHRRQDAPHPRPPGAGGRVQGADALALGVVLSLFSVMLMGMAVNWLAAACWPSPSSSTPWSTPMWLKRWTAQNIVIGGLAGALPPVIGWAAATGTAPLNAWLLCAIIFMWTPPHFWALSLYTSEDYAKAGVPMMPVVAGAASRRPAGRS